MSRFPQISLRSPVGSNEFLKSSSKSPFSESKTRRFNSLLSTHDVSRLLDFPSNFRKEERRSENKDLAEVSIQLSSLRKRHDVSISSYLARSTRMDKIKKDLTSYSRIETRVMCSFDQMVDIKQSLEDEISQVQGQQAEILNVQESYLQVIDRMTKEKVRLQQKSFKLNQDLNKINTSLRGLELKKRKAIENKAKIQNLYREMEDYARREIQDRKYDIKYTEKEVSTRLENAKRRDDREKRSLEIAEAAINEAQTKSLSDTREKMLLHKIWYQYLTNKMKRSHQSFSGIEEAFGRAKTIKKSVEIHDIVEKHLTREQEYKDLVVVVNQAKEKVERYYKLNQEMQDKIDHIRPEGQRELDTQELIDKKNELYELLQKKDNIKTIHLNIQDWGKRIMKRFSGLLQDSGDTHDLTVPEILRNISMMVRKVVTSSKDSPQKFSIVSFIDSIPENARKSLMFANIVQGDGEDEASFLKELVSQAN